jgi:hypothetical protein
METKFNFNSQICTDRSQSERLLALGLKKETADMALVPLMEWDDCTSQEYFTGIYTARAKEDAERYGLDYIPAWSLHRLLELNLLCCEQHFAFQFHITNIDNAYEYLVNHTEWLIKEGYFNKEYLEE